MERILSLLADLIQIGGVVDFSKITNIPNTNNFFLLVVIIAWIVSTRNKNKEILAMQNEIDKMARETRLLREEILLQKGMSHKEIKKLFPPDDNLKTRRKNNG